MGDYNKYGKLSREEVVNRATQWVLGGWDVYFKFMCEKCGAKCVLQKPNTLYEYGECHTCGHSTKLDKIGFLAARYVGGVEKRYISLN